MNYYASEVGLTKETKALLAKGVPHFVYPAPDFEPKPYTRAVPKEVKRYVKKGYGKRKVKSAMTEEQLESFQHHRIFAVIRGMN